MSNIYCCINEKTRIKERDINQWWWPVLGDRSLATDFFRPVGGTIGKNSLYRYKMCTSRKSAVKLLDAGQHPTNKIICALVLVIFSRNGFTTYCYHPNKRNFGLNNVSWTMPFLSYSIRRAETNHLNLMSRYTHKIMLYFLNLYFISVYDTKF